MAANGGRLTIHRRPNSEFALRPTYRDAFFGGLGRVLFLRDGQGKVAGMRLSGSRVWDLRFRKVE